MAFLCEADARVLSEPNWRIGRVLLRVMFGGKPVMFTGGKPVMFTGGKPVFCGHVLGQTGAIPMLSRNKKKKTKVLSSVAGVGLIK